MGIKASYYSRIPNSRFWTLAGKPVTRSQQLTSMQLGRLAEILTKPPSDPLHHVYCSHPAVKIEPSAPKDLRHYIPQRSWLELNVEIALPVRVSNKEYTAQEYRRDIIGLKHASTKDLVSKQNW